MANLAHKHSRRRRKCILPIREMTVNIVIVASVGFIMVFTLKKKYAKHQQERSGTQRGNLCITCL